MKNLLSIFAIFSFVMLAGCSSSPEAEIGKVYQGSPEQINITKNTIMSDFNQTSGPEKGDKIAVIKTNMGTIKIRLFPQFAPKTVENFIGLIEKDYYNGIIFHRVIPDFMIQGGDPTGTGTGGASLWGGTFEDEFNPNLSNIHGALSMANAGPGTNGSQFFIVQNKEGATFLDNRHSVFGQVFEGMDIVDKIANVDRDAADKPLKDVVMEKVTVKTF